MPHQLHDLERDRLAQALAEDIGDGDVTTRWTVDPSLRGRGVFRAKSALVLCGEPYAREVFAIVDPGLRWTASREDGASLSPGDAFAVVEGAMGALLEGERLALNLLQHLSGVATLTAAFVDAVAGTDARITDTRKTLPLWRSAQKYAVRCGGGVNHRFGLYDAVLIKDNHIDAGPDLFTVVRRAVEARPDPAMTVIVEIRREDEIDDAIRAGADRLLLDNMSPAALRACVERVGGRALTEASGGVTLGTVAAIAATGVDFVSVGALTHSAPAADIHFKIEPIRS